ncbi:MAG: hypothetical protein P4L59_20735 [Desulfosporosinus sp.]|nr:hypothetical protein [Desulfosporosinus sp.]
MFTTQPTLTGGMTIKEPVDWGNSSGHRIRQHQFKKLPGVRDCFKGSVGTVRNLQTFLG